MTTRRALALAGFLGALLLAGGDAASAEGLAKRGVCAHRGASHTHPENTIAALTEAVRLGAHMIEIDVQRTRDGKLALMHDKTVDRTTDGAGALAKLTLDELRRLDAGSWKGSAFRGERIPTFDEALAVVPKHVWINVHLKGDGALAEAVARRIVAHERLEHAFLACDADGAEAARRVERRIKVCNMGGRGSAREYEQATLALGADFMQLTAATPLGREAIEGLRRQNVRINYCCASRPEQLRELFDRGVEFVLADDVATMLVEAEKLGIERVKAAGGGG